MEYNPIYVQLDITDAKFGNNLRRTLCGPSIGYDEIRDFVSRYAADLDFSEFPKEINIKVSIDYNSRIKTT